MKKRKQIRKLKQRIAELETNTPPATIPSDPINPHDLWRNTTADYAQGEADGWADIWNESRGYL